MPASPRTLEVNYATLALGADSSLHQIQGPVAVELNPRSFSVEFKVLLKSASDIIFGAQALSLENTIRTPFQDLFITFNSVEIYDFRESTRKAFNVRGQITKSPDEMNTRVARVYTIRFEGDLAADRITGQPSGLIGWREATVGVVFDSAQIRQVTIAGEWTAVPLRTPAAAGGPTVARGARTAYENATSGVAAYALSVLTAIDSAATWRLQSENYDLDDHDLDDLSEGTILRFSRVYGEIVFPHAGTALAAGVETGAVVRQRLRISRDRSNVASAPGTRRLLTATATYEAWIDKNVVAGAQGGSNVTGGGLELLWDGTIRGQILNTIRGSGVLSGAIAVISENPTFEYDANKITAVIVAQGRGGPVIERRLTLEDHEIGGLITVPVWDGKKRTRYVYDAPIEHQRIINETSQFLLDIDRELGLSRSLGEEFAGGRIGERHSTTTPLVFGDVEGGGELKVIEATGRIVIQVFERTDGSRLSGQVTGDTPPPVFLFDFQKGILDFGASGSVFNVPPIQRRAIANL